MNNLGVYPGSLKSSVWEPGYHSSAPKTLFMIVTGNKLAARWYQASDMFLLFDSLSQTLGSSFSWNCNLHILVQEHASVKLCLTSTTSGPSLKSQSPNVYLVLLHKILQEANSLSIKLLETQKYHGKLFINTAWVQNYAQNKYSYHHYCSALTAVLRRP